MAQTSVTQIGRLAAARLNEELVLAESSLIGERRVSWARLAMVGLFALAQNVIAPLFGHHTVPDAARMIVGTAYGVVAVLVILQLRRVRPNPRLALLAPLGGAVLDFGFVVFMALRNHAVEGRTYAEMGVAAYAVMLCFSVARKGSIHVVWSTFLACASYLLVSSQTGSAAPLPSTFVIGGFLALGFLLGMTNHSVRRLFSDLRRRDNLSRFLPAPVVERVLNQGTVSLAPVQREVTVLFSDIRDFTALSENLPPRDVLELLDDYFARMAQVVKGRDGIVGKFLGDGLLAFWGVPDKKPDHAVLAMRAALDMRAVLVELNQQREASGAPALRIGVGVHTGPVAAGMLGGADQHEYTVIGDAVNVASRIEGLTKGLGVDILISENTWQLAGARFQGERLAEEKVKGRSATVVVYTLAGAASA